MQEPQTRARDQETHQDGDNFWSFLWGTSRTCRPPYATQHPPHPHTPHMGPAKHSHTTDKKWEVGGT